MLVREMPFLQFQKQCTHWELAYTCPRTAIYLYVSRSYYYMLVQADKTILMNSTVKLHTLFAVPSTPAW